MCLAKITHVKNHANINYYEPKFPIFLAIDTTERTGMVNLS